MRLAFIISTCCFLSTASCKPETNNSSNSDTASAPTNTSVPCILSPEQSQAAVTYLGTGKVKNLVQFDSVQRDDGKKILISLLKDDPKPCNKNEIEEFVTANTEDIDIRNQIMKNGDSMQLNGSYYDKGTMCLMAVSIVAMTVKTMVCERVGFGEAFERTTRGLGGK